MAGVYNNPPQPPGLRNHTPESVTAAFEAWAHKHRAALDAIVANVDLSDPKTVTFENVMRPELEFENEKYSHNLRFYQHVSANSGLRDTTRKMEKRYLDILTDMNMREDVFCARDALYHQSGLATSRKQDPARFITEDIAKNAGFEDVESAVALEEEWKAAISRGLGLPSQSQRDRFKQIQKRLEIIKSEFKNNHATDNGCNWFTRAELDGMDNDAIDQLAKGTGENEGKHKVTFDPSHYDIFLKTVKNPEARKRMWIAMENKCPENVPLFQEAMLLRDEAARLLGYPDHATLRVESRMAKTPTAVNNLLDDLRNRLAPLAARELNQLLEAKKTDCEARNLPFDGGFYYWDRAFYVSQVYKQEHDLDNKKIAEYFPIDSAITGMLRIFGELFGIVFVRLSAEDLERISPTRVAEDVMYHTDTIMFSVWNDEFEGNNFLGYLYIDAHPREGKYRHTANFQLELGHQKADNTRFYPSSALVCNFPAPTKGKPSLLDHEHVVDLFHELGHGIHGLVSRTRFSRHHGTAGKRDFVEAPSQMLEHWTWRAEYIQRISKHYQTSEQMPDDMAERIAASRHILKALSSLWQLSLAIFDMEVHSPKSRTELENMDFSRRYNELRNELTGMKGREALGEPMTHGHGNLQHLFSEYDAGLYSYHWSSTYSYDMFYSAFARDPMDKSQGHRYRHMVLEKGASQDEMFILEEFLGRKPTTDALFKELGPIESVDTPSLKKSSFAERGPVIEEGPSSEERPTVEERPILEGSPSVGGDLIVDGGPSSEGGQVVGGRDIEAGPSTEGGPVVEPTSPRERIRYRMRHIAAHFKRNRK
ncbi:zincin [Copromyces sp. CBS 386.78]|nr:zincin [Copromyces sp. CBS 386.78]